MPEREPTIHVLDPTVARKIAAGEVIERPAGVVRELLDNSLDAGATQIEVELSAGGRDLVRVVDNGSGMSRDDLERSVLPHATSKIATADDLLRVRTLGFRGEALSSIAAVSRLEITSAPAAGTPHRLRVEAGRVVDIAPAAGPPGTSVSVADLFFNVPARKQFLKRASSELAVARSVFLDKALPFPEVGFRLTTAGEVRRFLPPGSALSRIADAYPERTEPARLHELELSGEGFRGHLVAGEPGVPRKDRKGLQVFVNRRRIWEYALVQAVEYAYRDYLHGGLYPVAYLFLEVEPELVDFNIHPAKREVRFRTLPEIHRRVVGALSAWLRIFDRRAVATGESLPFNQPQPEDPSPKPAGHPTSAAGPVSRSDSAAAGSPHLVTNQSRSFASYDLNRVLSPEKTHNEAAEAPQVSQGPHFPGTGVGGGMAASPTGDHDFRYLGQLMDLFLVVERGERLYLVDQHAAHERIIYDRLRDGANGQELLFPVRLEVEPDAESALERHRPTLERLGFGLEQIDAGWELTAVPASVPVEAETLAALLMELLDRPADFERELYASLSCRSAVMDGDRLADETAVRIVAGVLGMENARCPHGRPLWIEWTREQLESLVGRT